MDFLQRLGRRLAETAPAKTAILTAGAGPEGSFVLVVGEEAGVELEVIGPEVAAALDGRGGGRPPLYQGRAGDIGRRGQALELLREAVER
jgi:alanyl-tRNA synthetase